MASISFMVTDNETGMMNNSFNFSEDDLKRISNALRILYKDKFPPLASDDDIKNEHLFATFAEYMIKYLLDICNKTEINEILTRARESAPEPIEVKGRSG